MKLVHAFFLFALLPTSCALLAQEAGQVNDPIAQGPSETRDPTIPSPEIRDKLQPKVETLPPTPTQPTIQRPSVTILPASKLNVRGLVIYPNKSATLAIGLADTVIRMQLDKAIYAEHMQIVKSKLLPKPRELSIEDRDDSDDDISLDYVFQLDTTYRVVSFNRQQVLVQRMADNHFYILRAQSSQIAPDTQPSDRNPN